MELSNIIEATKQRIRDLQKLNPAQDMMDEQELSEREGAAQAYAGESPEHFVEYCEDCIDTSVNAKRDLRKMQKECYAVYKEDQPENYAKKESWQSKVVLPKPFGTVQTAMSAVRKAFTPNFLSIENEINPQNADFWQKLMIQQLNKDHADFSIKFTDASGMGFAVGQSLEMIPVWREGRGLDYVLVEPWKIHRDPDAVARDSQSGMYWIHEEYLDRHVLKELEKSGKYINIDKIKEDSTDPKDELLSKDAIAERKNQTFERSKFRKAVLTSEFWGTILDKNGDLLLPNSTYTIAAGKIIELPRIVPYQTLRWPGTSFSPLPDFIAYEGRGLLQGIKSLWVFMCSLMCLHNDNLNWIVNPMTETDITSLVDQSDIDIYPNKHILTRGSANGQQVVRVIERASKTSDVIANLKFADYNYQSGSFVNDALAGRVSQGRDVTAREAAQNLDQAMGVFGLIGENVESGAIKAIKAGMETVMINAGPDDIALLFGEEVAQQFLNPDSETGISLPELNGSFHVSGLTAILKDNETMRNIRETILPLFIEGSPLAKYVNGYKLLKSIETRTNLKDEGLVVDETQAQEIDAREQERQDMVAQEQAKAIAQESELAGRVHAEKLEKISKDKATIDVRLVKELSKEDKKPQGVKNAKSS